MSCASEIIDEIQLTVAAIEDLAGMLLSNSERAAGGQCLWVLHKKLESDMDRLWTAVKEKTCQKGGKD